VLLSTCNLNSLDVGTNTLRALDETQIFDAMPEHSICTLSADICSLKIQEVLDFL